MGQMLFSAHETGTSSAGSSGVISISQYWRHRIGRAGLEISSCSLNEYNGSCYDLSDSDNETEIEIVFFIEFQSNGRKVCS